MLDHNAGFNQPETDRIEALKKHLETASALMDIPNLHAAAWEYLRAMEQQDGARLRHFGIDDHAHEAWRHLTQGDARAALESFRRSIAESATDRNAFIAISMLERSVSGGDSYNGHRFLLKGLDLWPNDAALNKQMAENLIFQNKRGEAVIYLKRAFRQNTGDIECLFRLLWVLGEHGLYESILEYYPDTQGIDNENMRRWVKGCVGHARVARTVDRNALRSIMLSQENSQGWFTATQVWAAMRQAIVERRPFSLVRFGDGEARFLFRDYPRSVNSETEREEFSDTAFLNWFGRASGTFSPAERAELFSRVHGAMAAADFLGLPQWERASGDNLHLGYLWFLQEFIDAEPALRGRRKTGCFVNVEMHKIDPFYVDLLQGADEIGVISCHSDLGDRLSDKLSKPVAAITVAGEKGQADLPAAAKAGTHYPDQYFTALDKLRGVSKGSVWLVAAGLLGKIYCAEIKRAGGIAVDIGSLADAWMGHNTRAGHFNDKSAFALKPIADG